MPPTTAVRRAPARHQSAELLPPPSQQLAPRPSSWGREATSWVAAGIAGFGAAPLLDHPGLAGPALVGGAATALTRGVVGRRRQIRGQLADRLVEALSPGLGLRGGPDRRVVRLKRWRRGWPGVPGRIELRYAPGVDDTDPRWRAALLSAVTRRLLADYEVAEHDRRRCRITLRWAPPQQARTEKAAAQLRAQRTISELLGPTAVVTGVEWAGEDLAALQVRHEAATKLAASGYRHRVERVMSTMLPGRWRARWDLEGDTVRFELRPALPKQVPHPVPVVAAMNRFHIPLAIDEDGATVTWNLRGTGPHLLVNGRTGAGKTVVMNGVVMEVTGAGREWAVWICDPKRIEFLGMRDWPNVQIVATTVPEQVVVIHRAWDEMERRYELIEAGEAVEDDFEPLVIVLDEYRDFFGIVAQWYAGIKVTGMPSRCPVLEKVSSIVRKGRSARIHVVLGMQRPDADILSGEMRDNFGTRISLGPLSPQGAMMMWESPHVGVSLPRGIAGRATAISDETHPAEVQAYWTPDPRRAAHSEDAQDLQLLEQLRPATAKHGPLRVHLDEELMTTPDEKGRSREWAAVMDGQLLPAAADPRQAAPPQAAPAAPPAQLRKLTLVTDEQIARRSDVDRAAPDQRDADQRDVEVDVDEPDEEAGGVDEQVPAGEVIPGDLVLVQDSPQVWGLVEAAEPDVDDQDLLCVDWRGDDDDAGAMLVPQDSLVTVRRWLTETPPGSEPQDWPWGG